MLSRFQGLLSTLGPKILSPSSNQILEEKEPLDVPVYLLSRFQLDTLLVEHVGEGHSVWVVFFPLIDPSGLRVPLLSH